MLVAVVVCAMILGNEECFTYKFKEPVYSDDYTLFMDKLCDGIKSDLLEEGFIVSKCEFIPVVGIRT